MTYQTTISDFNQAEASLISQAREVDQLCLEIKREAARQIEQICPAHKQRNLVFQAFTLWMQQCSGEALDEAQKQAAAEIEENWREINSIRQISKEMQHLAETGELPLNWRDPICWM